VAVIVGLAIVAGTGVALRDISSAETPEHVAGTPRQIPVKTMKAELSSCYAVRRSYTGKLVARRSTDLGFQRTGELDRILVEEGQTVAAGAELARLDIRRLGARRDELMARKAEAAARLAEMEAGPRKEVIDAARARLASWRAQVNELELQKARRQRLFDSNAASREDLENTTLRLQAATARLTEANHQLDELLNGTRSEQIDAQRAVVAQLDAQLADVAIEIDDSTIVAPFAGTIAARIADEGAVVSPGTPILRIVESGQLEAWIGLPVAEAGIAAEQQVHNLAIGGTTFQASFARSLPELDPATRTRTVILILTQEDSGRLVAGQIARLELPGTVDQSGFWVPTTALLKGQRGLWSVYVADRDEGNSHRAVRRDVEILHTESDRVFVRGTLRPGDLLITGGVHRIVPDQALKPLP
jgi:multidrug efflux pump subunit AcrA (membrane-fusion protein)